MLKVLCVVSSKFCKFTYVTENRLQVRSPRRNSKKGMEDDDRVFVGAGVARRAAYNAGRAANREARERGTYASAPRTQPRETLES